MMSKDEQQTIENKVIELLVEKNTYLGKFVEMSHNELMNFEEGFFDNIETFYHNRETILDIVKAIDVIIEDEVRRLDQVIIDDGTRFKIHSEMNHKDQLASEILNQDLKIISAIEKEKSNIIRELQQTKTSQKITTAYRTNATSAASPLPIRQFDEKA